MSYPSPTPAQPLETIQYANVRLNRRPGILTAIGILSIVIACLSGLSSCAGVGQGAVFLAMRNVKIPVPTAPVPPSSPAARAQPVVKVGDMVLDNDSLDGLVPPDAQRVMTAMARLRTLSNTRRAHLGLLLGAQGRTIFPALDGQKMTDASIARAISAGGMTDDGANWYTVGTGRIEINDHRALFRPSDGGEAIEASATGQVGEAGLAGHAAETAPPTTTAPPPMPVPMMPFKVDPTSAILSIIENGLSLMLAIVLLVGGILVLRDSQRARRLHMFYAAAKIPLAIFGGVAAAMVTRSMMSSMSPAMGGGSPTWLGLMQAMLAAGMALAYPIALLIVLNTKQLRDYYAQPDSSQHQPLTSPS